jgi:hypothetical protein
MPLQFDANGHLFPYDTISITMEELEEYFVFNEHRLGLYLSLKQFIRAVKEVGIVHFDMWIDGSFVTLKTRPNDIDAVCFIDSRRYDQHLPALTLLRRTFSPIDAYFVKMYGAEHPKHNFSKFDELDWCHFLTKDRKRRPKGIVKIQLLEA